MDDIFITMVKIILRLYINDILEIQNRQILKIIQAQIAQANIILILTWQTV